ncbi:MAG TPA: hypothetical protein VK348_11525, partial [Planctomycetota bacterium]|nr:hypothetical protein [Planctomycetota bacterium]
FVGGSNMWALVFSRFFPGVTPLSQVRCHVHASGDTTLLTSFGFFVPPANHNDWRPDVGGVEAFVAGSDALVVFQREDNTATAGSFANTDTSEVWGSLLDTTTANGTFGAPFLIRSFTSSDSERPTVNQAAEGGAAFSWICVCQEYNNSITNDDWDLIGRRISNTGAVATGTFITDLATLGNTHQLGPVVAGESGRYAVTFTTVDTTLVPFKTGLIAGKEVRTERFNWANALAGPSLVKPNVVLRANADRRWEATGLAYDSNSDSHWGVGFRAIVPGVPVAYYARIGFNGEATEGPIGSILYSVAGDTTTEVAVTFNNDLNTFQYAYGVNDGTITLPIYGQVLEYAVPSPISTFGISCSAANLSWTPSTFLGSQQIGCEFTNVNVTGAPVGAAHFMAASFGTTNVAVLDPAVAAGCRLFIQATGPLFLGVLPLRIGANANWSLPLPEFLPSTTLHFQDWYLDGAQFHSTERLTVPIIK